MKRPPTEAASLKTIYSHLLNPPPGAPQPLPVGPLRLDQIFTHSFREVNSCCQFNLHFAWHISLQRADAGVETIGAAKSVVATAKKTAIAACFILNDSPSLKMIAATTIG
jgi:hypothetical protein